MEKITLDTLRALARQTTDGSPAELIAWVEVFAARWQTLRHGRNIDHIARDLAVLEDSEDPVDVAFKDWLETEFGRHLREVEACRRKIGRIAKDHPHVADAAQASAEGYRDCWIAFREEE